MNSKLSPPARAKLKSGSSPSRKRTVKEAPVIQVQDSLISLGKTKLDEALQAESANKKPRRRPASARRKSAVQRSAGC